MDADGSGSVDFEEFLELMKMKTKESHEEAEIKEAFRILDRNNKGKALWIRTARFPSIDYSPSHKLGSGTTKQMSAAERSSKASSAEETIE